MRLYGNYRGRRHFDLQNWPSTSQKPYALANARLSWKSTGGHFGIDPSMRNITNSFSSTNKIDVTSGFGFIYNRVGEPRTFGATLRASF